MDELRQLRDVALRVDVNLFVRSRAGFYLLGLFPTAPGSPLAEGQVQYRPFATSPAFSVHEMMSMMNAEKEPELAGRFVCHVKKSRRNPFQGRISVGRAKNNDVVIVHPSVSKLHAHFFLQPGASPGGCESLRLADAGSRNGTRVDDRVVDVEESLPVTVGSRIQVGDVACTLLDAPALYRTLRSLIPARS